MVALSPGLTQTPTTYNSCTTHRLSDPGDFGLFLRSSSPSRFMRKASFLYPPTHRRALYTCNASVRHGDVYSYVPHMPQHSLSARGQSTFRDSGKASQLRQVMLADSLTLRTLPLPRSPLRLSLPLSGKGSMSALVSSSKSGCTTTVSLL